MKSGKNIRRDIGRNYGGIMMTMIASDAHDIDKKLQELEDEEIRSIMKERGYSEDDILKMI